MATATTSSLSPTGPPAGNDSLTEPLLNGDILYEVVDNEIREVAPMSARETRSASNLQRILGNFAWNNALGVTDVEMLFLIDKSRNLQRRPDFSYVSFERWPKGKPVPGTQAWEVVPDLAVEVVSPTNGANELREKVQDYFACGVRRVWLIYPLFSCIGLVSIVAWHRLVKRSHYSLRMGEAILRGSSRRLIMGRKRLGPSSSVPERNRQFARHLNRLLFKASLEPGELGRSWVGPKS